ncbi:MAG: proteasome-type protease [Rhodobacteraceae bacterium]|nr:proteasome-type protease [Paracoccaceae bacterium]
MTYCVAIRLTTGLVLLADTRTNAGVDNISKYRKLFTWTEPGERSVALMTAGNLAITQAVVSLLQEPIDNPGSNAESVLTAPTLFRVAELVGDAMREVQSRYGPGLAATGESATSSIVVAGQRAGGQVRLFLVYSAGNFIEATDDTSFFQIGEHKYGKPILDRVITPDTSLEDAKTAALLSMDSTLRSNLTVGMPLDLAVLPADSFAFSELRRIEPEDPHFHALSHAWSELMREAFVQARQQAQAEIQNGRKDGGQQMLG